MANSKKLQVDIPVKEINGKYIIKHSELEEIALSNNAEYDMQIVDTNMTHSVVVCNMTLFGTKVRTVGETTVNTLWNDIDRDYPVMVAWNRAFDRAVIKALEFDVPVYSNKELNMKNFKQKKAIYIPEETVTVSDSSKEEEKEEKQKVETVRSQKEIVSCSPKEEQKDEKQNAPVYCLFGSRKGQKVTKVTADTSYLNSLSKYLEEGSFDDPAIQRQAEEMVGGIR